MSDYIVSHKYQQHSNQHTGFAAIIFVDTIWSQMQRFTSYYTENNLFAYKIGESLNVWKLMLTYRQDEKVPDNADKI